ncbi:MAG: hypothetical protein J0J15_27245, partial [Mesorhizobium sp.]|nr:hypothetical protein [Mesorhizobium sp.]
MRLVSDMSPPSVLARRPAIDAEQERHRDWLIERAGLIDGASSLLTVAGAVALGRATELSAPPEQATPGKHGGEIAVTGIAGLAARWFPDDAVAFPLGDQRAYAPAHHRPMRDPVAHETVSTTNGRSCLSAIGLKVMQKIATRSGKRQEATTNEVKNGHWLTSLTRRCGVTGEAEGSDPTEQAATARFLDYCRWALFCFLWGPAGRIPAGRFARDSPVGAAPPALIARGAIYFRIPSYTAAYVAAGEGRKRCNPFTRLEIFGSGNQPVITVRPARF